MTIRTRLTLWYSGILFVALIAMALDCYYEFVVEPRNNLAHAPAGGKPDPEDSDFAEISEVLVACGLPAITIAVFGGWWMMRKAMAPVTSLTLAAAELNEHNLGRRLRASGNGDEFDQLTEVFNAMTGRLEQSFKRIRDFTLHASHELKTPLTVLRGEVETALHGETLPPAQRERLQSELEELDRLARIVDGLTLLTKADAGLVTVELKPLPFADLVRDCFADTQILAQMSGISVKLSECEPVTISGDAHRLRQLLLNLADNSVKYNHRGGRIEMSLRAQVGFAEFTISNTGPGIAPVDVPRVFDRFFRGDPAHGTTIEGCGLGLSIAQWIVSAHKGRITAASDLGALTTITVRLPLAPEAAGAVINKNFQSATADASRA